MLTDQATLIETLLPLMEKIERFRKLGRDGCRAYALPFCEAGQVVIARAEQKDTPSEPFGFAFWAKTDAATSDKLRSENVDPSDLGFDGLQTGPDAWFVEVACQPKLLEVFLESSAASVFPGQPVSIRLLDDDGTSKAIRMTPAD